MKRIIPILAARNLGGRVNNTLAVLTTALIGVLMIFAAVLA